MKANTQLDEMRDRLIDFHMQDPKERFCDALLRLVEDPLKPRDERGRLRVKSDSAASGNRVCAGLRDIPVFQHGSVMTAENEYRLGRRAFHQNQEESVAAAIAIVAVLLLAGGSYVLASRFHVRSVQLVEGSLYAFFALVAGISVVWYLLTLRRRREITWPHPPLYISQAKDREAVEAAYARNAIVLGYDVHGKPWLWPDATRVMQSVVFGATGSGKTTLLKNIITQDLFRVLGPPEDQHRTPMLIFDGKGDQDFLSDLLPAIEAAGRMHQLRVLSPSRPDISVRYNPFFSDAGLYEEHSNLVFESFDQEEDFFRGHQGNYLTDISRVLTYTGKRTTVYDVMVMALDPVVLREQLPLLAPGYRRLTASAISAA